MGVTGFKQSDFDAFYIDGLSERMEAIQTRIQPKFKEIGDELTTYISASLGNEMFLHIAKHARRSKYPPESTWLAISENKRGYKKHPHFQLGLFEDHLFIWFALIYEAPNKAEIAKEFLTDYDDLKSLPSDFVISLDHTKNESFPVSDLTQSNLERFRDVKKAEFLIGKHITPDSDLLNDSDKFVDFTKDTLDKLLPFYQKALSV